MSKMWIANLTTKAAGIQTIPKKTQDEADRWSRTQTYSKREKAQTDELFPGESVQLLF